MEDTVRAHLLERVRALPRHPGVYLWKGGAGEVLYVGKAIDLRSRTGSYLDADATAKTAALMQVARDLDFVAVRNEKEALLLEQTLIKRHRPRYNVRLTDDKQYPYIALTRDPYPRLVKTHRHLGSEATHFGPFPDGYGAFHVMQCLNDLLPLRRCKTLPKEKCLYYDIGKCIAPCIAACTDAEYEAVVQEARDVLAGRSDRLVGKLRSRMEDAAEAGRYEEAARLRDQMNGLIGVLERQHMVAERLEERDVAAMATQGDTAAVSLLHHRDGRLVDQSNFMIQGVANEDAGQALCDFLRGLYADRSVPRNLSVEATEAQAAALETDLRLLRGAAVTVESPQKGDKRRAIEMAQTNARLRLEQELAARARRGEGTVAALQAALGLPTVPRVIEGFDISHRAGEFMRAAMVRFVDGESDKAGYRTFNMRTVGADAVAAGTADTKGAGREVDDFAAIGEAVQRRYRGLQERGEALPDLVLIDGGPGQLAAAVAALRSAGLPSMPVCSLAKREEEVFLPARLKPLRLKRNDGALQLLQRVRDESHRFGITQVRRKATDAVAASPLDGVAGIGPKRRTELVRLFGGLEGLRAASVEDLEQVPGVSAKMAKAIVEALEAGTDDGVDLPEEHDAPAASP